MNKLILSSLVFLGVLCSYAETMTGDEILAMVRAHLPHDPLTLTGALKVKEKNGYTRSNLPVVMKLDWGAATPTAKYRIDEESLTITWKHETPQYDFSNPGNKPTGSILGSGFTWADLSFSVLWWPNAKLIDEAKKINRECYVVDVPVPNSNKTMRLWIEKKMGMLLEARTLDKKGKELSRLKIISIKKMDGMWVAKDLELRDKKTGSKTTLQISNLEWENPQPTSTAFDPAASINSLSMDLYNKLAAERDGNLFFSPYSIASALAMTYAGARGETAEQMNTALHFGGPQVTHPAFAYLRSALDKTADGVNIQLSIANALWPQKGYAFDPEYTNLVKSCYAGEIRSADYIADAESMRKGINQWVELKTNNRIQDMMPKGSVGPMTRLVLVNAIYFKGSWTSPFNPVATRPAPFTLADGSTVEVSMMAQKDNFKLAQTEKLQALELPYGDGGLSMIILLPCPGEKLEWIDPATLDFQETEIIVKLPKFKLESSFSLNQVLTELGMPLAFNPSGADFSGMDESRELYIGAAAHKAFIEVNEEGTEAAAATVVMMIGSSIPPHFTADHPFLFAIRENTTGTILFMGRVMNPEASS